MDRSLPGRDFALRQKRTELSTNLARAKLVDNRLRSPVGFADESGETALQPPEKTVQLYAIGVRSKHDPASPNAPQQDCF